MPRWVRAPSGTEGRTPAAGRSDVQTPPSPSSPIGSVLAGAPRGDRAHGAVGVNVAGAAAVSEFSGRVVHRHWPLKLDVGHRPVIGGVATSTIGLVSRRFPRDGLSVGGVAAGAFERAAMVRIPRRCVSVGHRRPSRGSVAELAGLCGDEVPGRLARSRRPIVASRARRGDARVVHARAGKADGALVTGLARRAGDDVFRRLADGRRAVVTGCASADGTGVVE
jgi:hypothetical protein